MFGYHKKNDVTWQDMMSNISIDKKNVLYRREGQITCQVLSLLYHHLFK